MNLKKQLRIYALDNALKYEGKARRGAVIGQVVNAYPEWKAKMQELQQVLDDVLKEVNSMTVFEQTAQLKELAPERLEPKEKKVKEGLKELPQAVEGRVVLRLEPSPSGGLHIGHAYPASLNVYYARHYHGKLILRISDTNPDNIDPVAYELLAEDMCWLYEKEPETVVQSDRMESYYTVGLRLIEDRHAYVCTCDPEEFRASLKKGVPCPCRDLSASEQIKRWHAMATTYNDGEAVVRMKTDLRHKNPALRDFPLFRVNSNKHPRVGTKYRVWPLMNLAVAVDDHELGLTHVIRGKDHLDNMRRQQYLYDAMGWKQPTYLHIGRINFEGLRLSASEISTDIREGKYTGWDDIRLPTLAALRRRGYQPRALIKFAESMGLTMVDKRVPAGEFFKSLNAFNRELIDPQAKRYFFVANPQEITIAGAPEQTIHLDLHPEHQHGGRELKAHDRYLLESGEIKDLEPSKLYRLMDCCNFRRTSDGFTYDPGDITTYRSNGEKILHWLPADADLTDVKLVMDDGSVLFGKGEPSMVDIETGTIVQFERKGFARLDHKEGDTLVFWWLHK